MRMPAPYGVGLACTPHSTSSSTPNTTVPMISVNTATLLTRAATWMLMMLMTTGSSIKMIATVEHQVRARVVDVELAEQQRGRDLSMIAPPPTAMYSRPAKPTNQP